MRETRPNREQRRHPERVQDQASPGTSPSRICMGPRDVSDPRAKNSGHEKKTADNWNQ